MSKENGNGNGFTAKCKALAPFAAILSVSILEVIALLMGINGNLFGLSIGIISGLGGLTGGYEIARRLKQNDKEEE